MISEENVQRLKKLKTELEQYKEFRKGHDEYRKKALDELDREKRRYERRKHASEWRLKDAESKISYNDSMIEVIEREIVMICLSELESKEKKETDL